MDAANDRITLPDWLTAGENSSRGQSLPASTRSFFEYVFDTILERVAAGVPFSEAVESDGRNIPLGQFSRWVHADPERERRYYEAQRISVDARMSMVEQKINNADELLDTREQISRAELQLNLLKWQASVYDRRRYGEVKQVQIDQTISVLGALRKAKERVIQGTVIDVLTDDDAKT